MIRLRIYMIVLAMLLTPSIGATANDVSCSNLDGRCNLAFVFELIPLAKRFVEHIDDMTGRVMLDSVEAIGDKIDEVLDDNPE